MTHCGNDPPVDQYPVLDHVLNVVNMGLPANTIKGSGFGVISETVGTSRQIQLSLKLIY